MYDTGKENLKMADAKATVAPFDLYSSHQETLAACVSKFKSPNVLELGMGWYSTPMLHYMCKDGFLQSVDCFADWAKNFRHLEVRSPEFPVPKPGEHWIDVVSKWDDFDFADRGGHRLYDPWDVVFVDHANDPSRVGNMMNKKHNRDRIRRDLEIKRLASLDVKLVVVHDTELMEGNYGYNEVFPLFRHQWRNERQLPFTTILSNVMPVEGICS